MDELRGYGVVDVERLTATTPSLLLKHTKLRAEGGLMTH